MSREFRSRFNSQALVNILQIRTINFRLFLVCIAAASVALPIALISIAKILLLTGGAALLLSYRKDASYEEAARHTILRSSTVILISVFAFATSVVWTAASLPEALGALGKYGKLLMIPLIVSLVKSREESLCALAAFAVGQIFLLISSWMLFLHLPVPWATSPTAGIYHAAFSSYLDQGIMSAVFAALCWHLRELVPSRFGRLIVTLLVLLALGNVFFVFDGRSGHVAAIILMSLAILWELPPKSRIAVIFLPFVLLFAIAIASPRVHHRLNLVVEEVGAFSSEKGANVQSGTSSGVRLQLWQRAIQSIAESPLIGSGIGSWTNEFNRIERERARKPQTVEPLGNPHQEYFLWGVQLGIPGLVLIFVLLITLLRDSKKMEESASRSVQSVVAALAITCLFNSIIYDALIGDFFCVTLGLLLALGLHPARVSGGANARTNIPITS